MGDEDGGAVVGARVELFEPAVGAGSTVSVFLSRTTEPAALPDVFDGGRSRVKAVDIVVSGDSPISVRLVGYVIGALELVEKFPKVSNEGHFPKAVEGMRARHAVAMFFSSDTLEAPLVSVDNEAKKLVTCKFPVPEELPPTYTGRSLRIKYFVQVYSGRKTSFFLRLTVIPRDSSGPKKSERIDASRRVAMFFTRPSDVAMGRRISVIHETQPHCNRRGEPKLFSVGSGEDQARKLRVHVFPTSLQPGSAIFVTASMPDGISVGRAVSVAVGLRQVEASFVSGGDDAHNEDDGEGGHGFTVLSTSVVDSQFWIVTAMKKSSRCLQVPRDAVGFSVFRSFTVWWELHFECQIEKTPGCVETYTWKTRLEH